MSISSRDEKFKNLIVLGTVFALLGLGISLYSLYHHIELKYFGEAGFMCNINDSLSCDDVANSRFSEDMWGNPLGIYGAGYFLGLIALLVVSRLKDALRSQALQTYGVLVAIGVLVSLTLGGISHFVIGKLCPSCIAVYVVTFAQAGILYFCREAIPRPLSFKQISNGSWYAVMALGVSIALFQLLKPAPTRNLTLDVPKTGEELAALRQKLAESGGLASGPSVLDSLSPQTAGGLKIDFSAYSGLGEDYRKGSDEAKVKIVEFADFQCPACATASKVMRQIANEFGDRVLIVFKSYPLDNVCNPGMQRAMHPFACEAAVLTRCAGTYGKFWPMHDKIFDNQSSIDSTRMTAWAKDLGLSNEQIEQCKASKDIVAKIQDDIRQANESGLTGTPTIFMNGRKYNGPLNFDELKSVIQALLES